MGLDITAYKKIIKANDTFDDNGKLIDEDDGFRLYKNDYFPNAANEIEDGKAYKAEDSYEFNAGGYIFYESWRNELAKLAGYKSSDDVRVYHSSGDFFELINFSDCHGVIGCAVSKKLLSDFEKWQSKVDQQQSKIFRDKYSKWKRAFSLASNEGAVKFY